MKTITITYDQDGTKSAFLKLCSKAWEENQGIIFANEAKKIKKKLEDYLKESLEKEDQKPDSINKGYIYKRAFTYLYPIIRAITGYKDFSKLEDKNKKKVLKLLKETGHTLADFYIKNYEELTKWNNKELNEKEAETEANIIPGKNTKKLIKELHTQKEPFTKNPETEEKLITAINNLIRESVPRSSIVYKEKNRNRSNRIIKRKYFNHTELCKALYEDIYKTIKEIIATRK